ncbi:hypothetical protein K438DRAFT_1979627 [Mycena galopus ATCC 62051]|nr:hypothetical protein K438DRAFT_1979627 [Mycena galopus ATCC 62051]
MSLLKPVTDDAMVGAEALAQAYEDVQYLSRLRYRAPPPMSIAVLDTSGPLAAIEDFTVQEWTNFSEHQPLNIQPTFSCSPQSTLLKTHEIADGQIMHESVAANVLRIFQDKRGQPYTMSCHEYTFHVEAPSDSETAWPLELVYPATERLNQAMVEMMPLGLLTDTDTTFPVHATSAIPPMLPMTERICNNKVSLALEKTGKLIYNFIKVIDNVTLVRTEAISVQPLRAASDMTLLTATLHPVRPDVSERLDSTMVLASTLIEPTDGVQYSSPFSADIGHRPTSEELFGSDTDSMPELEDASDSDALVDTGICPYCFHESHILFSDCPYKTIRPGFVGPIRREEELEERSEIVSATVRATLDQAVGSSVSEMLSKMAEGMYMSSSGEMTPLTEEMLKSYTKELDGNPREDSVLADELRDILAELPSEADRKDSTASHVTRPGTPFPFTGVVANSLAEHVDAISQAAQLDPPAFYRRGQIVTRETWSSSPPTDSANDTSSEENHEGSDARVSTTAAWTPEFFDWSVQPKYDEEWLIETIFDNRTGAPIVYGSSIPLNADQLGIMKPLPNYSLPTTSAHAIPPPIPVPTIVIEASPTEFDAPPEYSPQPDRFRDQFDPLGRMPRFALRPDQPEDVQLSLYYWAYEKALAQLDACRYEDETGSEPIEMALRILHGPLRSYVDYEAMAAEGIQTLQQLAPLTPPHSPLNLPMSPSSPISDDTPDSTQSSSSLDYSLPSTGSEITTPSDVVGTSLAEAEVADANTHDTGDLRSVLADHLDHDIEFYLREPRTLKRKHPHDEDESQEGRRLRIFSTLPDHFFRPYHNDTRNIKAGAMGHGDFRLFAGVRLGGIEGARRIEDPISHLYGITEQSFPTKYVQHPLFFEFEVAKMYTLWHILQRQGRTRLADNIHELLSIRLRDEFTVAQTITPKSLDDRYPELHSNYWELLRDPSESTSPYTYVSDDDSDSDSDLDDSSDYESASDGSEKLYVTVPNGWSRLRFSNTLAQTARSA